MRHDPPDRPDPGTATITDERSGNAHVLHVSGAIDANNAADWQAALTTKITAMPQETGAVVVDLTDVTLLSAIGTRALLASTAKVPLDLPITVIAQGTVLRVVELVNTARFQIAQELDDALRD